MADELMALGDDDDALETIIQIDWLYEVYAFASALLKQFDYDHPSRGPLQRAQSREEFDAGLAASLPAIARDRDGLLASLEPVV